MGGRFYSVLLFIKTPNERSDLEDVVSIRIYVHVHMYDRNPLNILVSWQLYVSKQKQKAVISHMGKISINKNMLQAEQIDLSFWPVDYYLHAFKKAIGILWTPHSSVRPYSLTNGYLCGHPE